MALQENTSEINISSAPMKKLLHGLRYLFVNSKTVPFIGALIMSYTYIEISVLSILMEYLTASITEVGYMWIGAIVTNIQDGLSSLFFVPVSLISEAYMGCFTMITVCAAASIQFYHWSLVFAASCQAIPLSLVISTINYCPQSLITPEEELWCG
ncbi:hypothetical protein VNO78_25984 [Psophocarpus tetragonolobus]|uniref:Uncharacterized protein n=1 Tax=Psophocarpus tetragonolobus TaxID=3891 RepID=A0AAN9S8P7_PSOTE